MAEITPFRLVVISSLNPSELTPEQQELVARFCGELGGGVLLLGGPDTYHKSGQGSRLEQLLPVTFDSSQGVVGIDRPFHMQITDEALQNPAFQIADQQANRAAWAQLPTFSEYGRVATAKPGAVVWARHEQDSNDAGKRILMASQRYGAGLSAVICIDNFWRWRLAKDANIQQFDRFWQQLFRYLGQAGRQDITLSFTDEELRLHSDVHMVVERQPGADAPRRKLRPRRPPPNTAWSCMTRVERRFLTKDASWCPRSPSTFPSTRRRRASTSRACRTPPAWSWPRAPSISAAANVELRGRRQP